MAAQQKNQSESSVSLPASHAGLPRGEQAYRYIRDAIRTGQLRPGDRLREADLATAIQLSRTPIREALARLESNGLIVNDAIRGLVVRELDLSAVNELYFMRETLEGTAAYLAAQHASDVELSILQDLCEQYRDAVHDDAADGVTINLKNRQFHGMLCQCAHNRYLLDTVNGLHDFLSLLGPTVLSDRERARETLLEHEAITAAIQNRDSAAAEQAMRAHIRASQKTRMKKIFTRQQTD